MKRNAFFISMLGLCGLIFFVAACGPGKPAKSKREVIEERVAKKMAIWRSNFQKRCRRRAMEEATALVDSILIATARSKKDTVDKPVKPLKPNFPVFEVPLDTTPIGPVIPSEKDTSVSNSHSANTRNGEVIKCAI